LIGFLVTNPFFLITDQIWNDFKDLVSYKEIMKIEKKREIQIRIIKIDFNRKIDVKKMRGATHAPLIPLSSSLFIKINLFNENGRMKGG
jgi:hypothetical protein